MFLNSSLPENPRKHQIIWRFGVEGSTSWHPHSSPLGEIHNLNLVDDAPSLGIIPWKLSVPTVCFDLASFKKDATNPEMYKQLYLQLWIPFIGKNVHQQF